MDEQTSGSGDVPSDNPLAAGWGFWLWWVLASTIAWAVGGPVGVAVGSSRDIIVAGYLGVALGGIMAGVLQWLVLRRLVARAGWWVLASTVGWVVGGPATAIVGGIRGGGHELGRARRRVRGDYWGCAAVAAAPATSWLWSAFRGPKLAGPQLKTTLDGRQDTVRG